MFIQKQLNISFLCYTFIGDKNEKRRYSWFNSISYGFYEKNLAPNLAAYGSTTSLLLARNSSI